MLVDHQHAVFAFSNQVLVVHLERRSAMRRRRNRMSDGTAGSTAAVSTAAMRVPTGSRPGAIEPGDLQRGAGARAFQIKMRLQRCRVTAFCRRHGRGGLSLRGRPLVELAAQAVMLG